MAFLGTLLRAKTIVRVARLVGRTACGFVVGGPVGAGIAASQELVSIGTEELVILAASILL